MHAGAVNLVRAAALTPPVAMTPSLLGTRPVIQSLVEELELLHYCWAYRVVDTRAFGIPQKRRRVFLLASLYGDPRDILLAQLAPAQHKASCGCFSCFRQGSQQAARAYAVDLSCWNTGGNADEMCTLTTQNGQRTMLVMPGQTPRIGMLTASDAERLQVTIFVLNPYNSSPSAI